MRKPSLSPGAWRSGLPFLAIVLGLALSATLWTHGAESDSLRLVPFPKEVRIDQGTFRFDRPLTLEVSYGGNSVMATQLVEELLVAGFKAPLVRAVRGSSLVARLSAGRARPYPKPSFRTNFTEEDYTVVVSPETIHIIGAGPAGLFHGVQTLRQLIRANRDQSGIPCLAIKDWPSLTWRAFQDDLTRGPSTKLENLEFQADLGAFFKLNVFTYYMEHQFAFKKHPEIGPQDGSLLPQELKALVTYAQFRNLNILGNQQSFGHFGAILAHPQYAPLRETPDLICPVIPQTYELLDDLYSEVIPLLPFPYFNVCCDETDGLGQGPSKPLMEKIGRGGVYVRHIQHLHELIHDKYGKRMMMWGDIILQHPDNLKEIPKDTIMLSWGYDGRASFEDQILPFSKSGYDFFVCPGVSCWNRVLPDFGTATTNIWHFVRDGVKHGAMGMINTAWDDNGETFNAPNWHGIAWGAECAWNASTTSPHAFNRRIGAVLFGEKSDHFGEAIKALSTPGVAGLPSASFWKTESGPIADSLAVNPHESAEKLLRPIQVARAHLDACRLEARVNASLLPYFLFGASRLELYVQRELDRTEAAALYDQAHHESQAEAVRLVAKTLEIIQADQARYAALARTFADLWNQENKPYALDWTLARYKSVGDQYQAQMDRLNSALATAKAGHQLPPAKEVGLDPSAGSTPR